MLWTVPVIAKAVAGSLFAGSAGFGFWHALCTPKIAKTVQDVFAACQLCNSRKDGSPQPWAIKKVSHTTQGYRLVMSFPYGKTLADVTRKADAINTALGVDVAFTRDGSALILDIPDTPLPSYLSYSEKLLQLTRGNWRVPIGMSSGGWVFHDFDEKPHVLLAGPTRNGKSVLLRLMISTLYLSHKPSQVEFVGVDMKPCSLEFRQFFGVWKHLVSEPAEFLRILVDAEHDMKERAAKLAEFNCTNVQEYEETTGDSFTRRFIIVDEYGKSFGSEVEDDIMAQMMQICALGAGLGVHVILCTQRPDADVINGKIRANIGSIVCLGAANEIQSRVILGHSGAETLPKVRGRAIYQSDDEVIVQVPYISKNKLARIIPKNIPMPLPKPDSTSLNTTQTRSPKVVRMDVH